MVEDATLGNAAFKGVEEEKHKKETEEETQYVMETEGESSKYDAGLH